MTSREINQTNDFSKKKLLILMPNFLRRFCCIIEKLFQVKHEKEQKYFFREAEKC